MYNVKIHACSLKPNGSEFGGRKEEKVKDEIYPIPYNNFETYDRKVLLKFSPKHTKREISSQAVNHLVLCQL